MKISRLAVVVIAAALVLTAAVAVFVVDWPMKGKQFPPQIRPVKTIVVRPAPALTTRKYPGKVRANEKVDLAFQVDGPLIELPVKKGQDVTTGELLARIDPRDFQNDLASKAAELERTDAYYQRIQKAVKTGAVSRTELSNAKADYDKALAEKRISEKALDDTNLRAKFDGVIADRYVENFQNVKAKEAIVSLQDISSVEIEVNVPEQRVVLPKIAQQKYRFTAKFDYLPDREFDLTLKEFAMEADPATQTYLATFVMLSPHDLAILPGMTATIHEHLKDAVQIDTTDYLLPIDAVAVDGLGNYYVWMVQHNADGTYNVHRQDIEVAEMIADRITVTAGLTSGATIAAAGVRLLQQGQQIRPLDETPGNTNK